MFTVDPREREGLELIGSFMEPPKITGEVFEKGYIDTEQDPVGLLATKAFMYHLLLDYRK